MQHIVFGVLIFAVTKSLAQETIRKPLTDQRVFSSTTLKNGVTVMAVSDSRASKAAWSVGLEVGSLYDPPNFPGLVHFFEHCLLFLGSKAYPAEGGFGHFVSEHGGASNAYTNLEHMAFYGTIDEIGLPGVLDRVGHFFIDPLFSKSMVEREIEAVNSEHLMTMPLLSWKMWSIIRSRISDVLGRFYTGTAESLKGGSDEMIDALKKLQVENSCASRIHVVVVANKTEADINALVEASFGNVPSSCAARKDLSMNSTVEVGKLMRMDSELSTPVLWAMFALEPTFMHYKQKPLAILQYLVNYAGPGSLQKWLKSEGLISDIKLVAEETSLKTLVHILCTLTRKGTTEPQTVAGAVIRYFRMAQETPTAQKMELLTSLQNATQMEFKFKEPSDSVLKDVADLARWRMFSDVADILTASSGVIDDPSISMQQEVLDQISASNVNFLLATPETIVRRDFTCNWYNTSASVDSIPDSWLVSNASLQFPPPLVTTLENTEIKETSTEIRQLTLTCNTSVELWVSGTSLARTPRVYLYIYLNVDASLAQTGMHTLFRRIHVALMQDALQSAKVSDTKSGYEFTIDGYAASFDGIMDTIGGAFGTLNGSYERALEVVVRELATDKVAVFHAIDFFEAFTTTFSHTNHSIATLVSKVTQENFQAYVDEVYRLGVRVQVLAYGNVDEQQACKYASTLVSSLGIPMISNSVRPRVLRTANSVTYSISNPIESDPNSVTLVVYPYGVATIKDYSSLMLIDQMMQHHVFDLLRTQKQLGYVVFGGIVYHENIAELRVYVQGARRSCDFVESAIEEVIFQFRDKIQALFEPDVFSKWKRILRSEISENDRNMKAEADRIWHQIRTELYCFKEKKLMLEALDQLTPEDILDVWNVIRSHPPVRVKLAPGEVVTAWDGDSKCI